MDLDLINKISNLTIYGYYDPSKCMVVVHFFNKDEPKNDIIAYLGKDMTWDVREITGENSKLFIDKEIVEISHRNLGFHKRGSKFDQFIRSSLNKVFPDQGEKPFEEKDQLFRILDRNEYDN